MGRRGAMKLLANILQAFKGLNSRRRRIYFRTLGVKIDGPVWLRNISIPRQWRSIHLGSNVALDDGVVILCSGDTEGEKIGIGARTYINRYTILDASESLVVGEDCMIGPHCYITDHDHEVKAGVALGALHLISAATKIGNRVWVGSNAVILKGVTIGDDSVIAAGAVVTKNVQSGQTVAGVPARPIR